MNIGTQAGRGTDAPQIGDNRSIGPGARIYGRITLGDNVAIGANAVVNTDFPEGNATLAGVPARKVSNKTSQSLLTDRQRSVLQQSDVRSPETPAATKAETSV